jgi:hypothetical protein
VRGRWQSAFGFAAAVGGENKSEKAKVKRKK